MDKRPKPPPPPKNVKIKDNYAPKVKAPKKVDQCNICPRCKQPIPISEMDQHVKVELLDPRWREQKKRALDKNRDTNLVDNANVVMASLKRLAEYRTDIFGGDELEVDRKMREEKARAAQKEMDVWDGHTASITSVTLKAQPTVQEQIAHIQKTLEAQNHIIGPRIPDFPNSSSLPPKPDLSIPAPGVQPIPVYPDAFEQFKTPQIPLQPPIQPVWDTLAVQPKLPEMTDVEYKEEESQQIKRPRIEEMPPLPGMIPESEFLQMYLGPIEVVIKKPQIAEREKDWSLDGSTLVLDGLPYSTLISELKNRISQLTKMPPSRMKLTINENVPHMRLTLKDTANLAYYNFRQSEYVVLAVKERGGKR
ncbi:SF3a splicing factor complex subunit [Nowakowskiella sp. JEL0407]|nr:SF3a splicing factor complex subunit [Nowakowskiella sp. JEL0407]